MGLFANMQTKAIEKNTDAPIVSSYYTAPQAIMAERPYYALVQAYRSWVYTCIDKIAKAVAMIPLNLYIYRRNGQKMVDLSWLASYKMMKTPGEKNYALKQLNLQRVEITSHPILDLLQHPNPMMTRFMMWYETMVRLELGGLCGWLNLRNQFNKPARLWPLPLTQFAMLRPKVSKSIEIEYWDYQDGDVKDRFPTENVLLMKYPHPASPFQGMSPLMAQTYPYDIDLFMMEQQRSFLKNNALLGNRFTTDQPLKANQVKELQEQFDQQFSGSLNSGKAMWLHSGFQTDKGGMTWREAMVDEVARYAREKLITSFDLSEGKVGLVRDVNRANMESLNETFINECLRPKCMLIEEVLETFFFPIWDEGITADFDLPDFSNDEQELKERESNLRTGYHSINEERRKNGEEDVSWGDKPWMPMSMTQVGSEQVVAAAGGSGGKGIKIWKGISPLLLDQDAEAHKGMSREFWTEERKDVYWKLFMARQESLYNAFVKPLQKILERQKHEVIRNVEKKGPNLLGKYSGWARAKVLGDIKASKPFTEMNIDKAKEEAFMKKTFRPIYRMIMEEAGNGRIDDLREGVKVQGEFDPDTPDAKKWLGDRLDLFSKSVAGTTFDEIDAILREGFANEDPIATITETLKEKFESWEQYRAPLIARTENISAMNQADLLAVDQAGLGDTLLKAWLSARDDHCRETHAEADRNYADGIPIDEDFQVGDDTMPCPGNGQLPEENINCRCTLLYIER